MKEALSSPFGHSSQGGNPKGSPPWRGVGEASPKTSSVCLKAWILRTLSSLATLLAQVRPLPNPSHRGCLIMANSSCPIRALPKSYAQKATPKELSRGGKVQKTGHHLNLTTTTSFLNKKIHYQF